MITFALETTITGVFPDLKACILWAHGVQVLNVLRGTYDECSAALEQGGKLALDNHDQINVHEDTLSRKEPIITTRSTQLKPAC